MTELTPERIAQLREILAKATPGIWKSAVDTWSAMALKRFIQSEFDGVAENLSIKNAEAIVAAVNTLPAALDEIERLSAAQERCRQETLYLHAANEELGPALFRVKAELDEAVDILDDVRTDCHRQGNQAEAMHRVISFLSRMDGRKDG